MSPVAVPRLARRLLIPVIACVILALLVPVSVAQDEVEMTVTAHDGGGDYWFEVEGMDGKNPGITLDPGVTYTVHFINEGQSMHNLHFGGPVGEATDLLEGGGEETITFTVPEDASGTGEYWCDPHKGLDMAGPVGFGEDPGAAPEDGGGDHGESAPHAEEVPPTGNEPAAGVMYTITAGVIGAVLLVMFAASKRA